MKIALDKVVKEKEEQALFYERKQSDMLTAKEKEYTDKIAVKEKECADKIAVKEKECADKILEITEKYTQDFQEKEKIYEEMLEEVVEKEKQFWVSC